MEAWDPTPVLSGGEPDVLSTTTITSSGGYALGGITEKPSVGMFVAVGSCGTTFDLVTATGLPLDMYQGLGSGDVLDGLTAFATPNATADDLAQGLDSAGYAGTLTSEGAVAGWILDSGGSPIGGATVTCSECPRTYYWDGNDWDGSSTSTAGDSLFAIPGGLIAVYEVSASGYDFDSSLSWYLSGVFIVMEFRAN
jgi:hypothetical protein